MSVCSSAGILGTGHYAPERLLTNFDLEKLVDTTDEWIRTRTGVETRHLAAASENTSDLCVKAGWKALEAAGLTAEDIDFVMVATASPDYVVPSTACLVQDKMGMKRAGGMDISAGCSGYIYAVATAAAMVKAGLYEYILVVGAEILSRLVNWQDRSTCILFGDGAGAAVIGAAEEGFGLLASDLGSDGSMGSILNIPASGVAEPVTHRAIDSNRIYIHMEGPEVFKAAVRHMENTTMAALEKAGVDKEEIEFFPAHIVDKKGNHDDTFFALNILQLIPCLDKEKSIFEIDEDNYYSIRKWFIDAQKMESYSIVRMKEHSSYIIVSEEFKNTCEREKLKGFNFTEEGYSIWR